MMEELAWHPLATPLSLPIPNTPEGQAGYKRIVNAATAYEAQQGILPQGIVTNMVEVAPTPTSCTAGPAGARRTRAGYTG